MAAINRVIAVRGRATPANPIVLDGPNRLPVQHDQAHYGSASASNPVSLCLTLLKLAGSNRAVTDHDRVIRAKGPASVR